MHSRNLLVVGTAAFAAFLASSASAETYALQTYGTADNPVEWSDDLNWAPTGVPGAGDSITWANVGDWNPYPYLAIDRDRTIASFTDKYRLVRFLKSTSASAPVVTLTITDGLGATDYQHYYVYSGVKFVLASTATMTGSHWGSSPITANLSSGGEMDVYGTISSRSIVWNVDNGAVLRFAPASYANFTSSSITTGGDVFNVTGGDLYITNGLAVTGGTSVYANAINQSSGSVTFGGNFTSAVTAWTYNWSGGTLAITENCTFGSNVSLVIPASANVTLNVASGKTFSVPNFTADSTATITKTGDGKFAMAPIDAAVVVSAGSLGLVSATTYDLSAVTFASGTMVELSSLGATVNSYDSSLINNATFNADLNGVAAGTVVFNSSDSTLLGKVQADLSSSVPSGLSLQVSGTVLSVEVQSAYNFTASGSILDASGWGGSVPAAGLDVAIDGAGVVATLSSGSFPAWNSIEVKNGATLRISTNATLPPITLNKSARLEITNDAVVTIANVADLIGIATAQQLPVLSIATNSTISVPSGMKFKNVDMRLYGTVTKASNSDASPVFGYAESGETTYFALTADGATFDFHSDYIDDGGIGRSYGVSCGAVYIARPASGGTVIPVGTITLRNSSRTVKGWNDFGDWEFGSNNPTSVPFSVLLDGTAIDCAANFYAAGAAHLSLVNGSCIRRNRSCLGHEFDMAVRYSSTVDVGEGCNIDFTTGAGSFGIDSQSVVDTVTVRDGGAYTVSYNSSGWGLGRFVSDGGVLGVTKLYKPSTADPRVRTALLWGFGAARLDGDLTIASVDMGIGNCDWDRHTTMANVPFSGSGDVTVTNGVPAYPFTVTMVNGANTATGTIKVAKVYGDAETMLYFADGANWAGTVVAGNVAFTNLVDAAGGAAVTFNNLRIPEGELVVRPGDTLTIDGAVLRQGGDTGRLVVTEGQANLRAKSPEALANANVRTAQGRRLALKPSKTADENGYYDFTAVVPTGITVIVR